MSETNLEQFREVMPAGRFTLQNSAMLKVRLENDQIQAKIGEIGGLIEADSKLVALVAKAAAPAMKRRPARGAKL